MEKLIKELIKIKSLSGKEDALAGFICKWLKKQQVDFVKDKGNVIVKIKGNDSKKALIFNGHMDTVSPGDLEKWKTNPYKPVSKKDRLYGLGASDMKGFLAVMLELIKNNSKKKPGCDLWFSFVVKEELDGSGSRDFVKWFKQIKEYEGYKSLAGVIGESTGLKEIEIGHKGNVFLKIKTTGDSGHGSQPEKIKEHAVYKMFKLVKKMEKIGEYWQKKYDNKFLGVPTVSLTGIKSGSLDSPNKFPNACISQFDIRTTPELDKNIYKELQKKFAKEEYKFIADPAPCGWCDKNAKIVKTLKKIVPEIKMSVSKGATDQCFFSEAGIETIIFGPGEKSVTHKENEWIKIDNLETNLRILNKLIKNWS